MTNQETRTLQDVRSSFLKKQAEDRENKRQVARITDDVLRVERCAHAPDPRKTRSSRTLCGRKRAGLRLAKKERGHVRTTCADCVLMAAWFNDGNASAFGKLPRGWRLP